MLQLLKKKKQESSSATGAEDDIRDLAEYVPYYSHFNASTLVTKNGELMQTIRIRCNRDGIAYESGKSDEETVREHIRAAIENAVTTDDYALWIHTFRRRRKMDFSHTVSEPFAAYAAEEWRKAHPWKFQYYNEIYISILYNGQGGELVDARMYKRPFSKKSNRNFRNAYLNHAASRLQSVTQSMLTHISPHYRAELLSIVERHGVYYSEPMEFAGKLLNLRMQAFPVRECDISRDLTNHSIMFGFNALETKDDAGHRLFGAILSLKQYREVPPSAADRLLQAPIECIVSQAFLFTSAKRALKEYTMQKGIFHISGDDYSNVASGLAEMLASDHGNPTDFATVQTTVMVIADEYKQLDAQVIMAQQAFGEMGLIVIREDVKLEECFWSQLPGNFPFVRRRDTIASHQVAGFARLNLFPDGQDANNHWGTAVALVPTLVNSPYFFNFHQRDNGHTLLLDFNPFQDNAASVLTNFLLTSSLKYQGRILIFDRKHSAYLLLDKLGGVYHRFAGQKKPTGALRLNPFALEDNKRNRGFLLAWLVTLIGPEAENDTARVSLETAIERLYASPAADRNLVRFAALLSDAPAIAEILGSFTGNGKYAGIFDAAAESLDLAAPLQAFDIDHASQKRYIVPLFAYLMHRIVLSLDGRPTLIVLHDACDLLENDFFAPRLDSLMDMLTQNNALLLATVQNPERCLAQNTFATLMEKTATQLVLPDDITPDYKSMLPILSEHDDRLMTRMDRAHGDFLVRQGKESIALCVNLNDMDAVRAIMANDVKTLIAAGGPFATLPKVPHG